MYIIYYTCRKTANEITNKLEQTSSMTNYGLNWEHNLQDILFNNEKPIIYIESRSPYDYFKNTSNNDDVTKLPISDCGESIRWCTINKQEWQKCSWTAAAASILGIQPNITCIEAKSPFQCFDLISNDEADIVTIDSHYGLLARKYLCIFI